MDNTKIKLVDVSPEEQEAFQKELTALLDKGNYYFEPIPQYQRVAIKNAEGKDMNGWMNISTFFLQKKVAIEDETATEAPVVKDAEVIENGVPSTDAEVNPAI